MNLRTNGQTVFFFLTCLALSAGGCHTTELLFVQESHPASSAVWRQTAPVIQPGDKLSITVWGHPELSIGDISGVANAGDATGKWLILNDRGEAKLPKIGLVKLAGLNVKEANLRLEQYLSDQLNDPIVLVRALNHRVTVLGEVQRPGNYELDNEPLSLVQGLALAAGLTENAEPKAIEVIRKSKNGPEKQRIDLTDLDALAAAGIFLQPDDVVYVPPTSRKAARRNLERVAPVISIISAAAVLISLFVK